MRIQYRYRQSVVTSSWLSVYGGSISTCMTPWTDVEHSSGLIRTMPDALNDLQVRIVDDEGNVISQTPPFKPAYYQRRRTNGTGEPGGITWCKTAPDNAFWIRRDDIKP